MYELVYHPDSQYISRTNSDIVRTISLFLKCHLQIDTSKINILYFRAMQWD